LDTADYCREIETYLCRKNDGHLIRVVGPSFDLVSDWAVRGVPLKVACAGIDRYFERYYRKGPRRRPVKIDFCEADVLDVFDEWRKAIGVTQSSVASRQSSVSRQSPVDSRPSSVGSDQSTVDGPEAGDGEHPAAGRQGLPAHLERVLLKLSSARARGSLGGEFDVLIDRVSAELDAARSQARGLRGAARRELVARLSALDAELMRRARSALDAANAAALAREAEEELAAFRSGMAPDAFARAREAATDRLVRERFALPTITFD
jgi:hypothetical protein